MHMLWITHTDQKVHHYFPASLSQDVNSRSFGVTRHNPKCAIFHEVVLHPPEWALDYPKHCWTLSTPQGLVSLSTCAIVSFVLSLQARNVSQRCVKCTVEQFEMWVVENELLSGLPPSVWPCFAIINILVCSLMELILKGARTRRLPGKFEDSRVW